MRKAEREASRIIRELESNDLYAVCPCCDGGGNGVDSDFLPFRPEPDVGSGVASSSSAWDITVP